MSGYAHPAVRSGRLAAYLFTVWQASEQGHSVIRSEDLADAVGVDGPSVRRDLSALLGDARPSRRGVGYRVDGLLAPLVGPDAGSGGAVLVAALANRGGFSPLQPGLDERLVEAASAVLALDFDIHRAAATHAGVKA